MLNAGDLLNILAYLKETGVAVAFGSAVNLVLTLLWALRWRAGLRFLGLRVSYLHALEAITSSFPIGVFIPGNKVAQEAFRIAYVRSPNIDRGKVISATTMEWVSEGIIVAALLIVALASRAPITLVGLAYAQAEQSSPEGRLRKAVLDFLSDLRTLASNKKMFATYMGLSFIIIMLDLFKVAYMLVILGYVPTILDAVILYVAIRVLSMAPTPAGVGVFDAGSFAALALMGVPAGIAALYVIALRLVDTVIPASVGLIVLTVTGSWRILEEARRWLRRGEP